MTSRTSFWTLSIKKISPTLKARYLGKRCISVKIMSSVAIFTWSSWVTWTNLLSFDFLSACEPGNSVVSVTCKICDPWYVWENEHDSSETCDACVFEDVVIPCKMEHNAWANSVRWRSDPLFTWCNIVPIVPRPCWFKVYKGLAISLLSSSSAAGAPLISSSRATINVFQPHNNV